MTRLCWYWRFIFLNLGLIWIASGQESCNTPSNRAGTCVSINDCPVVFQILNNGARRRDDTLYLRDSACGYKNDTLMVCCENENATSDMSSLLPTRPNCGKEASKHTVPNAVVDGPTSIYQYPWTGLVEYIDFKQVRTYACSATLISVKYALSAGHCIDAQKRSKSIALNVVFGEYDLTTNIDCQTIESVQVCNAPLVRAPIEECILHPDYSYNPGVNVIIADIALVRFIDDIQFTDFVRPICLPQMNLEDYLTDNFINLTVTGWNLIYSDRNTSRMSWKKLHIKIPAVKSSVCVERLHTRNLLKTLEQICAGGTIGKSTCNRDSGVPLMRLRNDQYEMIGVLSTGSAPCAQTKIPDVYTNIFFHLDWIRKTIKY